jgi:hypothetical protein
MTATICPLLSNDKKQHHQFLPPLTVFLWEIGLSKTCFQVDCSSLGNAYIIWALLNQNCDDFSWDRLGGSLSSHAF